MDGMDGIGGSGMDKKAFGAAVVSETMDKISSDPGFGADSYDVSKKVLSAYAGLNSATGMEGTALTDKETFGAAVVKDTMDLMNTNADGAKDSSYDFQTKVLGAFAEGGTIVNKKG